jgi:hypothetical protein
VQGKRTTPAQSTQGWFYRGNGDDEGRIASSSSDFLSPLKQGEEVTGETDARDQSPDTRVVLGFPSLRWCPHKVLLVAVPLFLTAETAEAGKDRPDAELFQCFEIFSVLSVCSVVRLGQQHPRGTLSSLKNCEILQSRSKKTQAAGPIKPTAWRMCCRSISLYFPLSECLWIRLSHKFGLE